MSAPGTARSTLARMTIVVLCTAGFVWGLTGCGGFPLNPLRFPFGTPVGGGGTGTGPGGSIIGGGGGAGGGGDQTNVDPCTESQARKFVRITMRNNSTDFVYYFMILIAFVNSDEYPDGAVCEDDISVYRQFGYSEIAAGAERNVGNYCIQGPALFYIHRGGRFSGATGSATLESAIAPALGTASTFDPFFSASGVQVPVPNRILFHNPGNQRPPITPINNDPCNATLIVTTSPCQLDAFYYVDNGGLPNGSAALGANSFRRVPAEIQGTGCECGLGSDEEAAASVLAPSRVTASEAECNQFFRGGRIEYVFVRDDRDPPYPQLLWRVTDQSGSRAHDFDPRANIR